MSYLAMARVYRPQAFDEVIAQSHITDTLRRALESDRVAPAYLFTARSLANRLSDKRLPY